jgi:hypothetical protein
LYVSKSRPAQADLQYSAIAAAARRAHTESHHSPDADMPLAAARAVAISGGAAKANGDPSSPKRIDPTDPVTRR